MSEVVATGVGLDCRDVGETAVSSDVVIADASRRGPYLEL